MIRMMCLTGLALATALATSAVRAQDTDVPPPPVAEEAVESPSDIRIVPPPPEPPAAPEEAPVVPEVEEPVVPEQAEVPPPEALAPVPDIPLKSEEYASDKGKCGKSCDVGCGLGGGLLACTPGKPWKMPQPCFLQRMGIGIGGWVQQGVTVNAEDPANGFNGPVATNDMDMKYQLNQLWMFLHKQADNGGCGWAWGGHLDMIYGTDFRFGINHGLEDRINSLDNQDYGLVIPQAYLEVAYNDLSVKLGHMAAILDYEVIPGPFNPFYSHSYSYGYTVPQLVTGVLADYKLSDQLSIQGGFHRGWFMFEDYDGNLDFMGGIKWTSCDKGTSLAYAVSTGRQTFDPLRFSDQNRFVHSFVLKHQVTKRLQYVAVQNLGIENEITIQGTPIQGQDAEWYGLNQYLLYKINDCWAANLRVEWMRDDDGMRIAGPGSIPGINAWDGSGFAGNFYEVTAGLNWRPRPNWLIRPEVRWDWYDGAANPFTGALPFDDGNSDDQFTAAVDAIFTF
jgi:hypothetical protein